jgi:hypothetical protein
MFNPSIAVYRRLLKTLRKKFVGDRKTYVEMRSSFKTDILKHRLEEDPVKISSIVFDLDQAREWITTEVMRADLMQDGKYKLRIIKEQLQSFNVKPVKKPQLFEFDVPCKLVVGDSCQKD